jgi:hypothetical protein
MDAHQQFQRPPDDRYTMQNPNHQPQAQRYAGYPPPTSQPQQPLHVPFAPDPYAASRRDPFLPAAVQAQHARRSSQGIPGGENAPPAQVERQNGWTHTGTDCLFRFLSQTPESCDTGPSVSDCSGPGRAATSRGTVGEPSGEARGRRLHSAAA